MIQKKIYKDFLFNSTGSLLAQVLSLLFILWTTKIYSPESFGKYATYFAKVSLLASVFTLRLDLSFTVNKLNKQFQTTLMTCFYLISIFSFLFIAFYLITPEFYKKLFFNQNWGVKSQLLYLSSLLVFPLLSLKTLNINILIRQGKFKTIAILTSLYPLLLGAMQVLINTLGTKNEEGLYYSLLFTLLAINVLYFSQTKSSLLISNKEYSLITFTNDIKLNKNYSLWRTLITICENIYSRAVYFVLEHFTTAHFLGQFNLAQRLLGPATTLFNALSNVFFHHGAVKSIEAIKPVIFRYLLIVSLCAAAVSGIFYSNGEFIITLIFDKKWAEAGQLLGILLIGQSILFITSGLTRLPDILGIQKSIFFFQFIFTIAMVLGLYYAGTNSFSNALLCMIYTSIIFIYNLVWIIFVFIKAKLTLYSLITSLILFTLTFLIFSLVNLEQVVNFFIGT